MSAPTRLGWSEPIVDPEVRRRASELADRLDVPTGHGPMGAPETERERRESWLLRAGLAMPAWCARDPRLGAAAGVVCAALDRLADAGGFVRCDEDTLAEAMRLHPGELEERLRAPLRRLHAIGIAVAVRGGGWVLRREHVEADEALDEAHPDELTEWARALPDADRAAVLATIAEMTGRML